MPIVTLARNLRAGDVCLASGARIHQVWRDGLYCHHMDGTFIVPHRKFPRDKVEVFVSYPSDDHATIHRREWNKRTAIQVETSS